METLSVAGVLFQNRTDRAASRLYQEESYPAMTKEPGTMLRLSILIGPGCTAILPFRIFDCPLPVSAPKRQQLNSAIVIQNLNQPNAVSVCNILNEAAPGLVCRKMAARVGCQLLMLSSYMNQAVTPYISSRSWCTLS